MSDDSDREHARVADEARRQAQEAAERASADAERVAADLLTGEMKAEGLRQAGVTYGALIGIAIVMVQPFLNAPTLDTSGRICIIAFAAAIPLLAALAMVNRQESFRGRRSPSVVATIAQAFAQGAALVGITAGFWHITWVAGVTFLVAAFVALGVHSAGFWRVETAREPTS